MTEAAADGIAWHALLNACLNLSSGVCIFFGWRAIKAGERMRHRKLMLSAVTFSLAFLVSYLARVYLEGSHPFPGHGWWKGVYFVVLFSHMILAMTLPVLVPMTVWRAIKGREAAHKKLARFTLPIWGYVSVTGVLVYVLLYHLHDLF